MTKSSGNTKSWKLPYIKGEKELANKVTSINRKLISAKIHVAYTVKKTSSLFHNKDKIPPNLSSNSVYKYTCLHCQNCYIGEPQWYLVTGAKEHIKGRSVPSEVNHHIYHAHEEDFTIVCRTKHVSGRKYCVERVK